MFTRRAFFGLLVGQIKEALPFAGDKVSVDEGYMRLDGSNNPGPAPGKTDCIWTAENGSLIIDWVNGTITVNSVIMTPYTGNDATEFNETTPNRGLRYWEDQTGGLSSIEFKRGSEMQVCQTHTQADAETLATARGNRIDQEFPIGFKDNKNRQYMVEMKLPLVM